MKLIYVYRHKKRKKDGTYYKLNNSYGRYCDRDAVISEAQKYSDTVECEDFVEKLDRRAVKLRYNAYCDGAKKYNDPAAMDTGTSDLKNILKLSTQHVPKSTASTELAGPFVVWEDTHYKRIL